MAENGIGSLLDEIEAEKPEPSEMADEMIAAAQSRENIGLFNDNPQAQTGNVSPALESSDQTTLLQDSEGTFFNPEMHASPPSKKDDGTWRKKRGRKAGVNYAAGNSGQTQSVEATAIDPRIAECKQAAAICAAQVFLIGQIIGGDEWTPRVDPVMGLDEKELMCAAWGDYFLEYGITKPPAWLGLTLVMSAYSAPRFFMPKTQHRWYRFRQFFSRLMAGKKGKAPAPEPKAEDKP